MTTKEKSTKISEMHYFFKNIPLYFLSWIRQPKYIVIMTARKGLSKCHDPGAWVLVLGRGHTSHMVNMHYLLLCQYTMYITLIDIVLGIILSCFPLRPLF